MTVMLIATYYLYAGAVVAAVFLLFLAGRVDENASGAWVFRPLIIPGVMLIWPLVLWRLAVPHTGAQELARHRMPRRTQELAQLGFVGAIVLIVLVGWTLRTDPTTLNAPVLLEAPE